MLSITCRSPKIAKPDILCILLNEHKTPRVLQKEMNLNPFKLLDRAAEYTDRETHVIAAWVCSQKNTENAINQHL